MYRNKVSNPPPQTSVYTYHMPECCCEIGGDQTFNHFSEVKSNKSWKIIICTDKLGMKLTKQIYILMFFFFLKLQIQLLEWG